MAAMLAVAQTGTVARTETGSFTAATQTVVMPVTSEVGSVSIQLTGTFVGTVTFEATVDGSTWTALAVAPVTTVASVRVLTATAVGIFTVNAAGLTSIRARCSAYTSGTVVVTMKRSRATPIVGAAS